MTDNVENKGELRRDIRKELTCTLDDSELAKYGRELSGRLSDLASIELEKKEAADNFKSRMSKIDKAIGEIQRKLHDGSEERVIECEQVLSFDTATVTIIRKDTGEVVEERPMTDEERQMPLGMDLDDADNEAPEEGEGDDDEPEEEETDPDVEG